METDELGELPERWITSYRNLFRCFTLTLLSLELCSTSSFWFIDIEIASRVKRLREQNISKGVGYHSGTN